MISIEPACSDHDLDVVRGLFKEYAAQIRDQVCFADFQSELDHLGEVYDVARGCLLLGKLDGAAVGCVGVRHIDPEMCEMKRLYVRPQARGRGLGRQLANAAIRAAEDIGYRRMRLETLLSMRAAQELYRSLGFDLRHSSEPIGPEVLRMSLELQKVGKSRAAATEAADAVGYSSVSAFYGRFKHATGLTADQYASMVARPSRPLVVALPRGFRGQVPIRMLARDPESLSERVRGNTVVKGIRLPSGPAILRMTMQSNRIRCQIEGIDDPTGDDVHRAHAVVLNLFGIRMDPARFEALTFGTPLEKIVQAKAGLRIPRTADAWEACVWAILGQQINLRFACTLRRRLTELCGERVDGMYAHPTPESVAGLDVSDLRALQFSKAKARYLIDLATRAAERPWLEDLAATTATSARRTLMEIRGIGPWSAGYILLRGFGFADAVPFGDAGLGLAIQRLEGMDHRATMTEQITFLAPFAPYRGIAAYHLWESLADQSSQTLPRHQLDGDTNA